MTNETKHTPLKHTQNCVNNGECQKNHTNAKTTETQRHTSELSNQGQIRGGQSEHALNAGEQKSGQNGPKTEKSLSTDTAVNVSAAGKKSLLSLQSTISTTTEPRSDDLESVVGDFINGLLKTTSLEKITDCFVSTVIALEEHSENAHTKSDAHLIAAAPELLKALEIAFDYFKRMEAIFDGESTTVQDDVLDNLFDEFIEVAPKAIAKAKGQS